MEGFQQGFQQFLGALTPRGGSTPRGDQQGGSKLGDISLEYTEAELAAATSNFDPFRRLGKGNYATVYRGTLRDGQEVAIKVLELDSSSPTGQHCGPGGDNGFADEVKVLSKFRHPNLVTLMGCGQGRGRRYLVYELLPGGDVAHRLQQARQQATGQPGGKPFPWSDRLSVLLDAACGLSHMHNSTPKAFHRDIKSANILLDRTGNAKMADFGLSGIAVRKEKLDMTCEQISGTPGYACPHYINSGKVSERTEVYAFGMVILELLLNTQPAALGQGGALVYPIFQIVMPQAPGALDRALRAVDAGAGFPPPLAREIAEFALACSAFEENRRPCFSDIVHKLRQLQGQFPPMAAAPGAQGAVYGQPTPQQQPMPVVGGPPTPGAGVPITRPQMPVGMPMPVAGHGGGVNVTNPQMGSAITAPPRNQRPAGVLQGFMAAVQELWDGGGADDDEVRGGGANRSAGRQMIEVVLECCFAIGVDLAAMPFKHKCLALRAGEGPWPIGRQQQPMLFARLVPDEAARTCISRIHFELAWEPNVLRLLKKTGNVLLLNGAPAPDQWVPVPNGTKISCCGPDNRTPILTFCVLLRDAAAVAAKGMTPQPTHPDLPANAPLQAGYMQPAKASAPGLYAQGPPHMQAMPQKQQAATDPPTQPQIQQQPYGVPPMQMGGGHQAQMGMSHQPPRWSYAGPPTPYRLVCVLARGCDDLDSWPLEQKMIGLPGDTKFTLGRQHQVGFFEALLSADQRYLTCVSRNHVELTPMPAHAGEPPGSFEVTNMSANPVVINHLQLKKGERSVLRPSAGMDFIAAVGRDPNPVCYLRLSLEPSSKASDVGRSTPRAGPSEMASAHVAAAEVPAKQYSAAPQLRGEWAAAVDQPVDDKTVMIPRKKPQADSLRAENQPSQPPQPPFYLILGGNAVRDEIEPARRRIAGTLEGLSVGRTHQQALLTDSLKKAVLQYISRNHFRIERDSRSNGGYQLVCLSSNPIWRSRSGKQVELNEGESPLGLQEADVIMLFTGADDCTPNGPGNEGLLNFTFLQEHMDDDMIRVREAMAAEPRGRSGGGVSPRSVLSSALNPRSPRSSGEGVGVRRDRSASPRRVAFQDSVADRPATGSGNTPRGGPTGAKALRAPVFSHSFEDDDDARPARSNYGHSEDNSVGLRDFDDKFSSSGFRY